MDTMIGGGVTRSRWSGMEEREQGLEGEDGKKADLH